MALAAGLYARSYSPAVGAAANYWQCLGCSRTIFSAGRVLQQQQPKSDDTEQKGSVGKSAAGSESSSSRPLTSRLGEVDADGFELVYEGFFSRPHRRLKYASLLNTFASFAAAPLIIQYSTASPIARVAVTTSVIAFAVITTGGLHWFTKPYVHQLWYSKQQQAVKAQTMSLLGGVKWRQFPIGSVTEFTGIHPMANFKADGRLFYVDPAVFHDTQLFKRLMPWSNEVEGSQTATVAAAAKTNGRQHPAEGASGPH